MEQDFYYELLKTIHEEVMYLKHYEGKVVDVIDELGIGRVKITIPEIGMDLPSNGVWAEPRQGCSMSPPTVGSWAEVYFVNGDRSKPRYLFPASGIKGNVPKTYSALEKIRVVFEDPESNTKHLSYSNGVFKFSKGSNPSSRMGDAVSSATLQDPVFWTWINAVGGVLAGLGVVAPIPTSLTGKIDEGTEEVLLP